MICCCNHLYIRGRPGMYGAEDCADYCLQLPRELVTHQNVEWIKNRNEWDARYSRRGCITELFLCLPYNLLGYERSDCSNICGVYSLAAGAIAYAVSYVVATPFDLLGKCLKECALEIDPEAQAYNQMAGKHLQFCTNNEPTLEEIEKLKRKLAPIKFQKDLYVQVLEKTKSHPIEGVYFEFDNETIVIRPIIENECIVDYEIGSAFKKINWLPMKRSTLSDSIKLNESELDSLEQQIKNKEKQLERVQQAKRDFKRQAKGEHEPLL